MRRFRSLPPKLMIKSKYRVAVGQALTVWIVILLTIHTGTAVALDLDCRRYEQLSWEQIQQGDDPWARRCRLFVNGETQELLQPQDDGHEQEIARIYSDIQFGNNLNAFNRAERWLSQHPDGDNLLTYNVTNLLMRAAYQLSRDDVAAKAAEQQIRLARALPSSKQQAIRFREFERAMIMLPRLKTEPHGALIEAKTTAHGRTLIQISIGGKMIDALVDTGAEFSVIPSDLASRLGFKVIDGIQVPFQQIFANPYYVSLATAPTMHIGEMQVDNTYFLVTDPIRDDGSYPHIVLGLQFIEQFGRIAFLDHGRKLALGSATPEVDCLGGEGQLFRHSDGIGMSVTLSGVLAPAHYDTGFPRSTVKEAPLSFYAPDRRIRKFPQGPGKIDRSPLVIGAFREFEFEMDGDPVKERNVLAFRSNDPSRKLDFPLTVGGSTTRRLDVIVLDFKTMRYAAVKDRDAQTDACLSAALAGSQQD